MKLRPIKTVVHIGSLDPSDKGCRGESLEGTGLSVSRHPEEWEAIARLGGQPWWTADVSPLRLVDGHALIRSRPRRQALEAWGLSQGLVTLGRAYAVRWFDEEFEQTMEMLVASRQEAREEAEDRDARILPRSVHLPTAALLSAMGHRCSQAGKPTPEALAMLATVWAERHGFDGMWWADTLDPENLSAPRGVIFKEALGKVDFALLRPAPVPRLPPALR